MADQNPTDPNMPAEPDAGDVTPPHGDELRSEATFGRTDRYANTDELDLDPSAPGPATPNEDGTMPGGDGTMNDERRRRFEEIDNVAENDARMAVRKREHSAD